MRASVLVLIGMALAGAACGSAAIPTTPTAITGATEVYTGTLSAAGTGFYSFTSVAVGNVQITFGSLTSVATGSPLTTAMQIGVGIPAGTGCSVQTSQVVAPALTAQMAMPLAAGTYCVSITDPGGLGGDANFAVRVTQGTLDLTAGTSPEVFASNLAVSGNSSRTFAMPAAGNVIVTLDSVTPSRVVGVGIGMWQVQNSICSLYQSVTSGPGAQVSATVDPGTYCVKVFDVGNLTDFVAFSASIIHP